MSFSAAALRTLLEALLPPRARGLLVALSGGADSAALLSAAAALGDSLRGLPLRAVHVDHGLQPAAAEFRAACQAMCTQLRIPLAILSARVEVPAGTSLEAAARGSRYAALELELHPGECLLTAHHREDQAETVLLQQLRGAGLKGLSAMPGCRPFGAGWHLRPLLDIGQRDLLAAFPVACAVEDPMNADLRFDRSYVRREIWPRIEARWPGAGIALSRGARHVADAQALLDSAAAADVARLRDGTALRVTGLRALRGARRRNAVRFWLQEAGVDPPSEARLIEALRQILEARDDHVPAVVWSEWALRRYRARLFVTDAVPPHLAGPLEWPVSVGSRLELNAGLGALRWVARRGGLDPARLPHTVDVHARAGGETLKPAAAARTQSVQHLCQSWGVLPWLRDALPLVSAAQGLLAIADLWTEARWCTAADASGIGLVWEDAPIIV